MYMNRLRHDDFLNIFQRAGHRILVNEPDVDQRSLELMRAGGVQVDERFKAKSEEVLSTISSWVVAQRQP